jgi:glucosylceramidase
MLSDFVIRDPYTYVQEGDITLDSFTIEKDKEFFIPLLKEILLINPDVKFLSAAWSAPGWMKKSNTLNGDEFDDRFENGACR